jgi:hypothetical protein
MVDPHPLNPEPEAPRPKQRGFLAREWPYFLILLLAFFGVAYTSFANTPMTRYWIVLAPFIGLICVISRWSEADNREQRVRLIWTQVLHWAAVLLAMQMLFVADIGHMMNADARALAALTVLALGTFTAGVHVASWRICLVGVVLAMGVPAIAWLEQSAFLLLLIVLLLGAIIAPFFFRDRWASPRRSVSSGPGATEPASSEAFRPRP